MKEKILIVDKEVDFTEGLRAELEKRNYDVSIAIHKSQAEEIVRTRKPDFIVLGVISPRGDAFQLHQWLKAMPVTKNLPIVVVDAPPEKQLVSGWRRDEGLRLEVEDYFSRPIKPSFLANVIEKLLDETTRKIKVLIADDHAVIREGVSALLNLQKDIVIIGEATDGQDAIEKTTKLLPDVVLMDLAMPAMNGIEATKQITRNCKEVKILVLSQYDDEDNIAASKQAGAFGFISKKSIGSQLVEAIRAAS